MLLTIKHAFVKSGICARGTNVATWLKSVSQYFLYNENEQFLLVFQLRNACTFCIYICGKIKDRKVIGMRRYRNPHNPISPH